MVWPTAAGLAPSRSQALALVERSSALTHLVSSAEYLARRRELRRGGVHDWSVQREQVLGTTGRRRGLLDLLGAPRTTTAVHVLRIGAALALLAPTPSPVRAVANGFLGITAAALYPRHHYGTDGSDQVTLHTQFATCIARSSSDPVVQDAVLWYLALQSTLGYAVSGWVKLAGRPWRDGSAVAGVMRTRTYGNEGLWTWYRDRPRAASLSAHAMLVFEAGFPLVFLARGAAALPFVACAAVFHLGIGATMGLGRFVTAFCSMLPAVLYVRTSPETSRLVPGIAATLGLTVLTAGAVTAAARRRAVLREADAPGVTILRGAGAAGNRPVGHDRLIARVGGQVDAGAPTVVLECGLLASPAYFAWLIEALGSDFRVVTYTRAGVGASDRPTTPFSVDSAAQDLAAVVEQIDDGTPVTLVGHSIGGLIARRATALIGERCAGIVYLDSSHPAQLDRSLAQRRSSALLGDHLAIVPPTIALGLGWMLTAPEWLRGLPWRARLLEQRQHRDSRLWWAGLREWRGMLEHFANPDTHRLEPLAVPALVLTASRTGVADAVHVELQDELAASHRWVDAGGAEASAERVSVDGADHLSIVTDALTAARCAARIAGFIHGLEPSRCRAA